jgi:hypothetical protein
MHIELWKILVAAALVIFAFLAYRRTFPPIAPPRRALLAAMRIGAFLLLGLLLLNPAFVSTRTEIRRPFVLVLLDHSRSMGVRDSSGETRLEDALDGVSELRRTLGGAKADVEVIPFAGTLSSLPLPAESTVRADGEGTDIWGALEAAQRRYRSRNLAAIILLTDGRVTRGMVTSGEGITVPVYAVGFGDTLAKADVSIDEVVVDRVAYRGTKVPVEAVIHATGFRGATLAVRLLEGGRLRDSASMSVRKDAEIITASLKYSADAEGEHRLSVEVAPAAGEEHRQNNVESFRLNVLKDKVRILYIDQFPDWNMTFMLDLVKRSRRLEVETVTWIAGKGFVLNPGEKPWVFPASATGFERYDLVIVSDDTRLFNARANAEALGAFAEAGGSVLFMADENSPLARAGSFEMLAPFLPVQRARGPRIEYTEGFVRISTEAFNDPVASMLAEGGSLEAMPPLSGRITGVAARSDARVPLVLGDGGSSVPFLVLSRRGEGLTSVVLGFPLWRWKLAGDRGKATYESFFGGLVQYLAEGGEAPALAVDADRTVYRAGDRIRLTAYIGERRAPEGIRAEVRDKARGGDRVVSTAVFEPDSRRKGYYRAVLDPLPSGEYGITASAITGVGGGISGTASFSVAPVSVEFLDTSRDAPALAQIAAATRGAYLEGARLGGLATHLRLEEQRVEHKAVHEIRGELLVFIGIVAFLGVEWILRKAWGLV